MERIQFEQLVEKGLLLIPEKFRHLMKNVSIVIDDYPTQEQLRKSRVGSGRTLLGLYEGIPQTQRTTHYANVLPDKITIFQKPIESIAQTPLAIENLVANTVWHEIAHHFGLNENEVRNAKRNV
ncbi:MAG: metallopeptidase family protein [Candidatus Pacebacteria bacterium]|nr:metallopeptidase family protein [Candidatus Paceibacterota bacterium]